MTIRRIGAHTGHIQSIATRKKADGNLSADGSVLIGEQDVQQPSAQYDRRCGLLQILKIHINQCRMMFF